MILPKQVRTFGLFEAQNIKSVMEKVSKQFNLLSFSRCQVQSILKEVHLCLSYHFCQTLCEKKKMFRNVPYMMFKTKHH